MPEKHFMRFRENIVGINATLTTPYGTKPLVYADWVASGRMYKPIETIIVERFGPLVANTHSESSDTGQIMTHSYHMSHQLIKEHVNAGEQDVIITAGFGMTAVVNKLQRILGLKTGEPGGGLDLSCGLPAEKMQPGDDRPIVFVTHMEHHSNHTSWLETIADVVVLEPDANLRVDTGALERGLERFADRSVKIGAFSAGSNVTGLFPPYRELARIMHRHGGIAFVDFAAAAPYLDIDMHPTGDPEGFLDGIYFSPHKFLGGPGASGVLVFNSSLYNRSVPDHPGGGTVSWTSRWGERVYFSDIEAREDGGTPGFLQSIKTALAIQLKNEMGVQAMAVREHELLGRAFEGMAKIPGVHVLGDTAGERIGMIAFRVDGLHHNLAVRLLNDRFGIQARGGCSCAGTYGHFLLDLTRNKSHQIADKIDHGDLSSKPGWVRISLHPTMSDAELDYVIDAIGQMSEHNEWSQDYQYDSHTNEFFHMSSPGKVMEDFRKWFEVG